MRLTFVQQRLLTYLLTYYLAMLNFETVPRVRTRLIAADRRLRRATAAVRTLL